VATIDPNLYKKYFVRWMRRAAEEFDLPGLEWLLPTREELEGMPADRLQGVLDQIMSQVMPGQNLLPEGGGGEGGQQ
jgi:hypothetical protein